MNKYLLFLIIVIIPLVYADSGSFTVDGLDGEILEGEYNLTCGELSSLGFNFQYPLFFGVNESGLVYVTIDDINSSDNLSVQIGIEDVYYDLYYQSPNFWYGTLTFDNVSDVVSTIHVASDRYECSDVNYTLRVRQPFYVDIRMYEYKQNDTDSVRLIKKNNMFLGLKPEDSVKVSPKWSTLGNGMRMFGNTIKYDESEGYWDQYTNGFSRIKLYESGNYTLFTLNVDINPTKYIGSEFYFPKINNIDKMIITKINNVNSTNNAFDIYLTPVERQLSNGLDYVFSMIVAILIWVIVMGVLAYVVKSPQIIMMIGVPSFIFLIGFVSWVF